MEEGNAGREIGIPWIPVTPGKKAIPLRAGAEPPVVELEDGLGSESGSESEDEEVEEYPPGFEPKVRYTEPALLFDVHVNVVDSMRRGNSSFEADDFGGGEGYDAISSKRRGNSGFEADDFGGGEGYDAIPIEMGPFSRLLAMADANRLVEKYGSTCGRYAGPVSCSCMNCGMEHLGSSSSINHQNWCFPWMYSTDSGCRGIGGHSEAQSHFCEITRPWNALDAVNKETGPPLTPVTPDMARGLQSRNSEAESLSACDRTNSERHSHENDESARGSSEEPLKDSQCSTITKASTEGQIIDKGDTLGIELKTPQKKERRRKHRPKVVKEGKPGRPSSRKRTVDETGVLSDTPKPKRKYVRRKGIENAQTGSQEGQGDSTNQETVKSEPVMKSRGRKPKVDVDGGTNPKPSALNPVQKRKYVRKQKGVDNDNATSSAKVPSNLTDSTILDNNTSRKSCRRGLNFGSEGLTGEGNDDQTTRIPAERNNDSQNNEARCSPFLRRKRTRTQLVSPTASDRVKWSSELTDEKATVEGRCENFQNVVLTGGEAAMTPSREYSDPVVEDLSGSHCSSFQAHRYWALSLSNLQKRITVNDGHYSILESDVPAANHGLSGAPSRLISFHQEGAIQFPAIVGQTDSCSDQVAGAVMSSERSYQYPAEYMYSQVGIASDAQTSGSYPEVVWNFSRCMNDLVKQLWKLNINKKGGRRKNHKQCALASYDIIYRQYNALVLYRPAGSIVPFRNSSSEPKRRQQRAKVELDNETIKVWQLLLENIDNKGIDGTDKQKAKWWEEERAVFQGRADSFIARMRLVQGDRRFSPWKGSVLDSVVGVFLTQNVSDHLSSSAFMALAARYPLKSSQNKYSDEGTKLVASDCVASSKEESNGLIPSKDVILASCENNANIQNKTSCRNFDGIALEAKISPSFTQLLNMANEGVQSDKHSTCPNEELKHDFTAFPHFCGEASESTPSSQSSTPMDQKTPRRKSKSSVKKEIQEFDWDSLRKKVEACGRKTARTPDTMDSLDWEVLRHAPVSEVADTIKERGMNNRLAERIQDFLNRVVRDHKKLDLEWLRDIPPDKAKEYLLSFRGLGLKSVECVRLLTLHHLAFPVDTNVGRIAVRLGWVPLQPLPESLQLHLLEMYPILESIQQYLWPRLCKLDQGTLYELHYQMITFGKVFCTKSKPNCNACPMRGECRHFASAFASARLALPASEQSTRDGTTEENTRALDPPGPLPLPSPPEKEVIDIEDLAVTCRQTSCQPIIEEPASPEPECPTSLGNDQEESIAVIEDDDEIPTIRLNMEEFSRNLQMYMQENMATQEAAMSKALVALTPEAALVPAPPLKGYTRLRTEHLVYEIPEGHALLNGLDKLEPDDPCRYLLAIWTPGETATSIRPPERGCTLEGGQLCEEPSCATCNGVREANSQIVRGTILIPCRTAMRGSFPLNGTYFQVNEVFADHESSINPLNVPRSLIWNLHRRTVYFGTSISAIFKGLSTEAIQHCFWRGYICVRGFDRKTRAPRPLMARLHFPASKMAKAKGKTNDE